MEQAIAESGVEPSGAASEADVVLEDAPAEPEHDYNAPENQPPSVAANRDKALDALEV